jgi:hydrogenase maturation protein HypF
MKELVDSAASCAESEGLKQIGLTGGVSYNGTITRMFTEMVSAKGMEPILHKDVPNGDGGVSVGQAAIAVSRL